MATTETAKLVVELEVEGDKDDALHVVDRLLDAGFFQDAINEHDVEDAGTLRVKVAVVRAERDDLDRLAQVRDEARAMALNEAAAVCAERAEAFVVARDATTDRDRRRRMEHCGEVARTCRDRILGLKAPAKGGA